MEDKRGKEHIKLNTEYGGKTQLNLGHNVDAARAKRGEGFELRTDEWGALRAGKGIFISADAQPAASGKQLEMDEAIAQLEQALTLARTLAGVAQIAKATPGDTDSQKALNASLAKLKAAGILISAPQGIGIVSPKAVRVASGSESVGMMSGSNTDISSGKSFTAAAGESVSLLAQKAGMKLIAGKGKVDIQAQDDELSALAKNDITVTSAEGKITVTASKELILTCGGGYIKLSGGNIEIADPRNILFKSANWQKMGPASLNVPLPQLPAAYSGKFTAISETGTPVALQNYLITLNSGQKIFGITNANGETIPVTSAQAGEAFEIEMLADDFWYDSEMVAERVHYTNIEDASHHGGDCQCDKCEGNENE